jgi:hypothetical protein
MKAFVEAEAPRVSCPTHGVVVAHVPWARHTRGFDDVRATFSRLTTSDALDRTTTVGA